MPAPLPATNPWLRNQGKTNYLSNIRTTPGLNYEHVSDPIPSKVNPNSFQNGTPQNNFNSLVGEFNLLNQLIDLEKMVRLVRELNSQLRGCTNELNKFIKFNQFCQSKFMANTNTANTCQLDVARGTRTGSGPVSRN